MKYIVNNYIVFDPRKRTLSIQAESGLELLLPEPACRLLNEFIKHEGELLTREYLLKNVWEDFGFSVSDANLNNNVSVLRKSFVSLNELKPVIITTPKLGLQFTANIQAIIDNNKSGDDEIFDTKIDNGSQLNTYCMIQKNNKLNSHLIIKNEKPDFTSNLPILSYLFLTMKKYNYCGIYILLVIVFFFIGFVFYQTNSSQQVNPVFVYSDNQCDVYAIDGSIKKENEDFIVRARKAIKNEKINCTVSKVDVFYDDNHSGENKMRGEIYLLSTCKLNKKSDYSRCYNTRKLGGHSGN